MADRRFRDLAVDPATMEAQASAMTRRRRREAGLRLGLAADALAGFRRRSHVFGFNKGQFSMIDLGAAVLEKTGPADVSVWTWVVAEYEVGAVSAFIEAGAIRGFRMIIDLTGARRDMPYVGELQRKFGVDCLRVTRNHAKVITVATDDGWRVVIRGSMNLNNNPRFEQFDVSDDADTYRVVRGLEDEMWRRGRPLPVRELDRREAIGLMDQAGTDEAASWGPAGGKGWW